MRYQWRILLGLLSLGGMGLQGCGDDVTVGHEVGNRAPYFALPDTEGQNVRLSDFRGQHPVVVVFYRTSG